MYYVVLFKDRCMKKIYAEKVESHDGMLFFKDEMNRIRFIANNDLVVSVEIKYSK